MLLFKPKRITSILASWGSKKTKPPYQMGYIQVGQPIGFANYGITYSQGYGVQAPPSPISIKRGQPIGLANYGMTYSTDIQ